MIRGSSSIPRRRFCTTDSAFFHLRWFYMFERSSCRSPLVLRFCIDGQMKKW